MPEAWFTARVKPPDDGFRPQRAPGVAQGPRVARVLNAVDHVRIHVLAVAGRVVAGGIADHRRMVLGHAHVELRVPRIAVGLVRVRRGPVVVAEVRLGEGHQHSFVVGGPQHLLEADMRARFAAVVVRVDEVDPEALEALQGRPGAVVTGRGGAELAVVERDGRQVQTRAVQVEIPPVDPELAEPEADGQGRIQDRPAGVEQREAEVVLVLGRVSVPELLGPPVLGDHQAADGQVALLERPAGELLHLPVPVLDAGAQEVARVAVESVQRRVERNLPPAHGGVHFHIRDTRAGRRGAKLHVAAEPPPPRSALHLPGRGGVAVGQHDSLQRQGHDEHGDQVRPARTARGG